jgi:hypothetical protein
MAYIDQTMITDLVRQYVAESVKRDIAAKVDLLIENRFELELQRIIGEKLEGMVSKAREEGANELRIQLAAKIVEALTPTNKAGG